MKAFFSTLLIIVIICATCVVTCPNKEAHTDALMEVFTEVAEEKMGEEKNNDELTMVLSSMALGLGKMIVKTNMQVDNYFLFSIGKLGENTVSIGVMNHVFTMSKEDLLKKMEEQE